MIVIGIDPGLARTGYGVLSTDGRFPAALAFGCIETGGDRSPSGRLLEIYERVSALFDEHAPECIVLEDLPRPDDAADGLAIALCHINMVR
ncbi:MAG: crossover junction endodeoxyribonuclease RuvC, partial [Methanoculleus sp.]|nr:crossover junction endodeoxyribonuclease RuvC [Methanoculleus sp.]MDK2974201.1 crossover junction endodeoxyribonuclease RuvC [Methanofollis sp.]